MFSRKQNPANTRLQRKVVPFVAVKMPFSVYGSFSREKRLSPHRTPRLSLLPHSPRRTQVRLKPLLSLPGSRQTYTEPTGFLRRVSAAKPASAPARF
jgi:hypothetical protein